MPGYKPLIYRKEAALRSLGLSYVNICPSGLNPSFARTRLVLEQDVEITPIILKKARKLMGKR